MAALAVPARVVFAWPTQRRRAIVGGAHFVLTAGGVSGPNVKAVRRVHQARQSAVAASPRARYTNVPESGHQLPIDAPEAVVAAIVGVLDAVHMNS